MHKERKNKEDMEGVYERNFGNSRTMIIRQILIV